MAEAIERAYARRVRLVVVEDDRRYRLSLEAVITHTPDFELVASYGEPAPAVAAAEQAVRPPWDLVLMDVELPGFSGIEATRRLKRVLPELAIVMLTVFEEPATVIEAICAGADGYLLKKSSATELVAGIRQVAAGGSPLTAGVARSLLEVVRGMSEAASAAPSRLDLSPREQEVLRALVNGQSYKQVAATLDISIDTVRGHIRRLYKKLQVHSVAEAVTRAIRERLV